MSTPAVRVAAGRGVAVRSKGLIAWFDIPSGTEPATLVRSLVLAAGARPGLPVEELEETLASTPGLALAVVSLGEEFGRAWVCGDAGVTIDGPDDRTEVAAGPGMTAQRTFPMPRYAVRLGEAGVIDTWSHLIEGAVPAGGIAIVWDPSVHPPMPVRPVATAHGPAAAAQPVLPRPTASASDGLAPGIHPVGGTGPAAGADSTPGTDPTAGTDPESDDERSAGGQAGPGQPPRSEPVFEAISLLANHPVVAAAPLPLAGDEPATDKDAADEVEVAGLRCANGHFNHPLAANCGWCGIGMIQASHVLVKGPRPPLGVLVVDGHATFTLDADYVLGRQPHLRPEVDGRRVREIVLSADRSISRAHAAVRLVDWDVLVEDLGSGIGTWLQQPNQLPFQLPPVHPVSMAPGAIVHLGPHRLTYHSHFLR